MKIKHLSARNFTGTNFDIELDQVNIVTGDNFSGKTAIPNAIRLVFTGSLPPPIGIRGIYGGAGNQNGASQMSVEAELDNGRKVGLRWNRDAKGKISQEGGIPLDLTMPPMLANPRSFWAKTGQERVQIIAESVGGGADLAARFTACLGSVNLQPADVLVKVREQAATWIQERFTEGPNPNAAAQALIASVKDIAKSRAAEAKRFGAEIEAVQLPLNKPADVSAELEQARLDLAKVQVGEEGNRAIHEKGLAEIDAKLVAYSRRHKQTPVDKLTEFLRHELATYDADLKRLVPPPPMDELQEELEAAQSELNHATISSQQQASHIQRVQTALDDLKIATACPTCAAKAPGWKDKALKQLTSVLKTEQAALADFTAKAATATAKVQRLQSTIKDVQMATNTFNTEHARLSAGRAAMQADADTIADLLESRTETAGLLAKAQQTDPAAAQRAQELRAEIGRLQGMAEQRQQFETAWAKRVEIERNCAESTAWAEMLKAVLKLVVEEQRKATEEAFGAVLHTAREFTDGILRSPLEFVDGDLGRRVCEADTARPGFCGRIGDWISHEWFSDSEQRIAYAAFSVALAAEAPVKLVVLDELATLEPRRKVLFVDRLFQLCRKGVIDQAIVLEPCAEDYRAFEAVPGIRIIRL